MQLTAFKKRVVTGSARLDIYRKGGDSLAGRHHLLHLYPLSVNEIDPSKTHNHTNEIVENLLRFSQYIYCFKIFY
ncbi:MAG: hypothetical protein HQK51_07755 [Oligoflexia bacterium]|nr:hypothetical protein [Oligoflexia bacterium]